MSGATIAIIVIVALVVLVFGGCLTCMCIGGVSSYSAKSKAKSEPPSRPSPPTTPQSDAKWITAERPYVKFKAPAGWSTEITSDKEWGIFKSPAHDAVFAFTTFTRPGESTVRLGRAEHVLGVTNINWTSPRRTHVGRDKFEARAADGSCNFRGPGGYTWYATVNSGTSDQMLLIFTTSASAPQARRNEAQASIDSLQRR